MRGRARQRRDPSPTPHQSHFAITNTPPYSVSTLPAPYPTSPTPASGPGQARHRRRLPLPRNPTTPPIGAARGARLLTRRLYWIWAISGCLCHYLSLRESSQVGLGERPAGLRFEGNSEEPLPRRTHQSQMKLAERVIRCDTERHLRSSNDTKVDRQPEVLYRSPLDTLSPGVVLA